jgi:hypothetical protein
MVQKEEARSGVEQGPGFRGRAGWAGPGEGEEVMVACKGIGFGGEDERLV